ncbi:hypothetical protein SUZIE_165460 [Sciurus carolinensis]|uniref:Uncharacterized protein n=1 Tax=Sciurus carolinensis TaxID=30640 RepID=A0AA41N1G9_SCICA|nr:hypothetical protein [Sciurus carolinensis]
MVDHRTPAFCVDMEDLREMAAWSSTARPRWSTWFSSRRRKSWSGVAMNARTMWLKELEVAKGGQADLVLLQAEERSWEKKLEMY